MKRPVGSAKQQQATRVSHLLSEANTCLNEKTTPKTQVKAREISTAPANTEAQAPLEEGRCADKKR